MTKLSTTRTNGHFMSTTTLPFPILTCSPSRCLSLSGLQMSRQLQRILLLTQRKLPLLPMLTRRPLRLPKTLPSLPPLCQVLPKLSRSIQRRAKTRRLRGRALTYLWKKIPLTTKRIAQVLSLARRLSHLLPLIKGLPHPLLLLANSLTLVVSLTWTLIHQDNPPTISLTHWRNSLRPVSFTYVSFYRMYYLFYTYSNSI